MSEPKCPKCGVTMYDDKCCLYCGYGLPQLTPEDREAMDSIDLTNLFGPLDEQLKRAIDFGMRQFREVKRLRRAGDDLLKRLNAVYNEQDRTCPWKYDRVHEKYDTGCGHGWEFSNDGDVKDNGLVFCPFCGGKVTEEPSDE